MRSSLSTALLEATLAGALLASACGGGSGNTPDGGGRGDAPAGPADACVGLRCKQVACPGTTTTSLSGKVYAPNGTLPLYGVNVYVPGADPGPLPAGVHCDRCDAQLPGDPIVSTVTNEAGAFKLENVPVTAGLPVVIQVGKWRRQVMVDTQAASCQDTPVPAALTRLPKNHAEGDLPQIAITTGAADALECLVRKLGVDDAEITTAADATPGRIHLFSGNGANAFAGTFPGGARAFPAAATLWGSLDALKAYDLVFFSCEGAQNANDKPLAAMQAVSDYSDLGGRVFMSHWHNIWLEGNSQAARGGAAAYGPAPGWQGIATFSDGSGTLPSGTPAIIDEMQPKGRSFATWMENVGGSPVRDIIPINAGKLTCSAIDATRADRWVYLDPARSGGNSGVQTLQFTTPQAMASGARCGKVVFSDMHVASGSTSAAGTPFPGGCDTGELSAQEKALAFMFFDIASCVGTIF